MVLWFAGLAPIIVWNVFHDPAIDYRLVIGGALIPDIVAAPFRGARVLHSGLASAVLWAVVMVATRGRRRLRRRVLAVPVGTFLHLLLDGMWTRSRVFWWPFLGLAFGRMGLPSLDPPAAVTVVEE